ncbi:hypothetical protein J5289_03620 [Rhizobium sp. B230/85]|uniref:hypothetical protein n=1 Tax=unclassified Rhizobium TaxID=2613769 RepID=UPI001ADB25B5|nr:MULTISPECIES: hypothetical protein [unclassified Rhizobium]MBO9134192.1 hypothetical protein [Rhizobium sp. B209b/85]QXZ96683.1 hypothetical protein J5289_03620 [Rhizobium sp. B230/85]
MANIKRTLLTPEELKAHKQALQKKAYRKRQEAAGKAPRKALAPEEERKAALKAAQRRWYERQKQDQKWLEDRSAYHRARYVRLNGPLKPKLTEEERRQRQQDYRESYVRPEPSAAQKAKWSAKKQLKWAEYYASETPEQRERRLAAKAFYRMTEVQPKVREIVDQIKFDFDNATSEDARQFVADEWADTGLSCWLTAKALWYQAVSKVMEQYGYGD